MKADTMTYAESLRSDQARAVRERILLAALAEVEAGGEPTMRAVARRAGVAERTIYRYFTTREALQEAVLHEIRTRSSAPMAESVDGLADYLRELFTTFDRNRRLVRVLLTAPWSPTPVTRPRNLEALRRLLDAAFPGAPEADRASAAASLRVLYSAAGWLYLADCGLDLEASIRHVHWNTEVVLARLREASGAQHA
jgi:AcrR family transcriptional regulator